MTTFGYEAEFHGNVEPLMGVLHARRLTGTPELHSYHCRCETCDFDSGYVYRGQHDSSCGGEIISHVFDTDDMDEATSAMMALQEAAIDVDAEPSLQAGLHVHVGVGDFIRRGHERKEALWAYLRWEGWLGKTIANARWRDTRGANYTLLSTISSLYLPDVLGDAGLDNPGLPDPCQPRPGIGYIGRLEQELGEGPHLDAIRQGYMQWAYGDEERHLWLNVNTRNHKTWEFRLWNSTRVAWRMELFARLSLLFLTPEAVPELLTVTPSTEAMLTIANNLDAPLAALIERQAANVGTNTVFTIL